MLQKVRSYISFENEALVVAASGVLILWGRHFGVPFEGSS